MSVTVNQYHCWWLTSAVLSGGGSTTNTALDKFGPALQWMSYEASLAGLRFEEGRRQWERGNISASMTLIWKIVECLPVKRLLYDRYLHPKNISKNRLPPDITDVARQTATTWLPHMSGCRQIQQGQCIHWSVNRKEVPFRIPEFAPTEKDVYTRLVLRPLDEALQRGCILDEKTAPLFELIISSEDGFQLLTEDNIMGYIYDVVRLIQSTVNAPAKILEDLGTIYYACLEAAVRFNRLIDLPHSETSSAISLLGLRGHARTVSSVAFLSDNRVISGSWDRTLRIWDVITGEMTLGNPLSGHSDFRICVAVHTAKGLVASASGESKIHLWTSDGNGAIHSGKVLKDRGSAWFLAVAISPDGSHLVSGSQDDAIRVWNADTGKRVGEPVRIHTDWVWSVVFSSDGKRIVSGSGDHTVRLWEWSPDDKTLRACGEPLNGHAGPVYSVAFSPDASMIASGSRDRTVRIWDVATRTSKFTLADHTDGVISVAFAPSGIHIVSGSDDWTVRIWDASAGTAVRVLRGHTGAVMSVAFSPDGQRIASGSVDNIVRVWDFVPPPDACHPDEDAQEVPAQIEPE